MSRSEIGRPSEALEASSHDALHRAALECAQGRYELLGELGRDQHSLALLARALGDGRLAVIHAHPIPGAMLPRAAIVEELDTALPLNGSACPFCHRALTTWVRSCDGCGKDLAGPAYDRTDGMSRHDLLTDIREAAAEQGDYAVLGDIPRAGGGLVYFASESRSLSLLGLALQEGGEGLELVPVWTMRDMPRLTDTAPPVNNGGTVVQRGTIDAAARKVVAVEVKPEEVALDAIGDSLMLRTRMLDRAGAEVAGAVVDWKSSNPDIVRIDENGTVHAVRPGNAVIKGRCGAAVVSVRARMEQRIAAIWIEPTDVTLTAIGEIALLQCTALDRNRHAVTGPQIHWTSKNPDVASVMPDGVITAIGNGRAEVEARSGLVSGTVSVLVEQMPARLDIANPAVRLTSLNEETTPAVRVFDARGAVISRARLEWVSRNPDVAAVSDGIVRAISNGHTEVEVRSGAIAESIAVEVLQVPARIVMSADTILLPSLRDTAALSCLVLDASGKQIPDAAVLWSSTDPNIASVDEFGLVAALRPGVTQVEARAGEVLGASRVSVEQVAVSIRVAPGELHFESVGASAPLSVRVVDWNEHEITQAAIEWSSSVPAVAEVDAAGLVTAAGNGRAEIRATCGAGIGTVTVTVAQQAATLEIVDNDITLHAIGERRRIAARLTDINGHDVSGSTTLKWSSAAPAVFSVDSTGTVEAIASGSGIVELRCGSLHDKAHVVVRQEPKRIETNPGALHLPARGDRAMLTATVVDANGHPIPDAGVEWQSQDSAIAAVEPDGTVVAGDIGTTQITARYDLIDVCVPVAVRQAPSSIVSRPAHFELTALGATVTMDVNVFDGSGNQIPGAPLEFSSSNLEVATVDRSGVVTATGAGNTVIAVVSAPASLTVPVSVRQIPRRIRLNSEPLILTSLDQRMDVPAVLLDENGHRIRDASIEWTSADTAVVTVDAHGTVRTIGPGRTEIVARAGDATACLPVRVEQAITLIEIQPKVVRLKSIGEHLTLSATAWDAQEYEVVDATFEWSSSNTAVVVAGSDGRIRAAGSGDAEVRARCGQVEGRVPITVRPVAARLELSPAEPPGLMPGETCTIAGRLVDANGNPVDGESIVWESTNLSVLRLTGYGDVVAVGPGRADIRARVSGLEAQVRINVVAATVRPPEPNQGERSGGSPDGPAIPDEPERIAPPEVDSWSQDLLVDRGRRSQHWLLLTVLIAALSVGAFYTWRFVLASPASPQVDDLVEVRFVNAAPQGSVVRIDGVIVGADLVHVQPGWHSIDVVRNDSTLKSVMLRIDAGVPRTVDRSVAAYR